MFTSDKVLLY